MKTLKAYARLFVSLILGRKKVFGVLYADLLDSEYFDPVFYAGQAKRHFLTRRKAIEHYLFSGAESGLDPSELFNTEWYKQNNPDVMKSGINPLVHFVLHGEDEGRSPVPAQHSDSGFTSPEVCNNKLWGGFSSLVIPKLESFIHTGRKYQRLQSLWYLACWKYALGSEEETFDLLKEAETSQKTPRKKIIIGQAKCLFALEKPSEMAALLKKYGNFLANEKEYPYLKANLANLVYDDDLWIKTINSIWERSELVGIKKIDAGQSLALGNIAPATKATVKLNVGNYPKVSVIVAAYNSAETIHIALQGLIQQSWPNLEIIVVDDCSSDNTQEVIKEFCRVAGNIKYFRNERNLGAYPTRNHGYEHSTGEFITVHDSDDWSHPQKIELQVKALLKDASKPASISSWVRVKDRIMFFGPWMLGEEYLEINHSSVMVRKNVIEKHGGWDNVNVEADAEFLRRLKMVYGEDGILEVLPDVPLSFAMLITDSLTQQASTHVKTTFFGLRRLYQESANWWHENYSKELSIISSQRKFPCPLGNVRGASNQFDSIIAGDFSVANKQLDSLLMEVNKKLSRSIRLVLFHWPDYRQIRQEKMSFRVFDLCIDKNISFTHSGHSLYAKEFCLFDSDLALRIPDELPEVHGLIKLHFLGPPSHGAEIFLNDLKQRLEGNNYVH